MTLKLIICSFLHACVFAVAGYCSWGRSQEFCVGIDIDLPHKPHASGYLPCGRAQYKGQVLELKAEGYCGWVSVEGFEYDPERGLGRNASSAWLLELTKHVATEQL
eukprot:m.243980 g.243980  ORF g.243980 m.243980 type:complete len:106 (+) comp19465_c0_seq11:1380-1697(+)